MFLEAYRKMWGDEIYSKFTSERMELRSALRQIRRETPIEQDEQKRLLKIAEDIKRLDAKKVTADYVKKGYLALLEKEGERCFLALHRVISVYINLIEDIKQCVRTAQTMHLEAQREEATATNDAARQSARVKMNLAGQMLMKLNGDLDTIEKGLTAFFQNIDSRESLTLTGRKLLDKQSLERTIIYEFRQEVGLDRDFKRSAKELKAVTQRSYHKATAQAIKETIEKDEVKLSDSIVAVVRGLNQITSDLVQDLNRIHEKIQAVTDENKGKNVPLMSIDDKTVPSVTVLQMSTKDGGQGFPENTSDKAGSSYILKETKKLNDWFEGQIVELEKQIRMLMSKPENAKVKAA